MSSVPAFLSQQARQVAQSLLTAIDGTRAVVVATADGFDLVQVGYSGVEASRLAAMVSSFAALGDAASRESGLGTPRCLVIDSTDGRLMVRCMQVRDHAIVVVVVTDKTALLGLVWNHLAAAEKTMNAE